MPDPSLHEVLKGLVENVLESADDRYGGCVRYPSNNYYISNAIRQIRKTQQSLSKKMRAQLRAERKRVKQMETALRTIDNMTAVLQDAEKCQALLTQVNLEAKKGLTDD